MLHRNVREDLIDVDGLLGAGTSLGCIAGGGIACALRHDLTHAEVAILTNQWDVVLVHVTPALNGVFSLNLVLNQHVLHLLQRLIHALGHSLKLLLFLRIKIAHVLEGNTGLVACTGSIYELRISLCNDTVSLWHVAHQQVLAHIPLRQTGLDNHFNNGL